MENKIKRQQKRSAKQRATFENRKLFKLTKQREFRKEEILQLKPQKYKESQRSLRTITCQKNGQAKENNKLKNEQKEVISILS